MKLRFCACCHEALYCSRRCQHRHSIAHKSVQWPLQTVGDFASEWRSRLRLAGIILPLFDSSCRQNDVHDIWVESLRPGDYVDAWVDGSWQDVYVSDGDIGCLELRATQCGGVSRWLDRLVLDTTRIRPPATRRIVWRRLMKSNDIVEYHRFGRWRWAHVARMDGERIYLETTEGSFWSHRSDPQGSVLISDMNSESQWKGFYLIAQRRPIKAVIMQAYRTAWVSSTRILPRRSTRLPFPWSGRVVESRKYARTGG